MAEEELAKFPYAAKVAGMMPDNLDGHYIGCQTLTDLVLVINRMPIDAVVCSVKEDGTVSGLTDDELAEFDTAMNAVDKMDPEELRFGGSE